MPSSDMVNEQSVLPYAEAIRELVGLARLCERAGGAKRSERLRGAIDIVAVIYGVHRPDVVLDLNAELLLEGLDFNLEE